MSSSSSPSSSSSGGLSSSWRRPPSSSSRSSSGRSSSGSGRRSSGGSGGSGRRRSGRGSLRSSSASSSSGAASGTGAGPSAAVWRAPNVQEYRKAFFVGDLHGDVEVFLRFLEFAGLRVNAKARRAEDLASWGDSVRDTFLVVCGDWIDRTKRPNMARDPKTYDKLVYDADGNRLLRVKGSDGEIPMEELIVLRVAKRLLDTQAKGHNRLICVMGNHDIDFLVDKGCTHGYTTDLTYLSAQRAAEGGRGRRASAAVLRDDAEKVWTGLFATAKADGGVLSEETIKEYSSRFELSEWAATERTPCPRLELHRAYKDLADRGAVFPFYTIGNAIFSHAGFTNTVAELWAELVEDPRGLTRALCDPEWTEEGVARFLREGARDDPGAAIRELRRVFTLRPKDRGATARRHLREMRDPILPETLVRLGHRAHEALTQNVLAHNCGSEGTFMRNPDPEHVTMMDECASRANVMRRRTRTIPSGDVLVGLMTLGLKKGAGRREGGGLPSGPEHFVRETSIFRLPPIGTAFRRGDVGKPIPLEEFATEKAENIDGPAFFNQSRLPALEDQLGLIVLADRVRAVRKGPLFWRMRPQADVPADEAVRRRREEVLSSSSGRTARR